MKITPLPHHPLTSQNHFMLHSIHPPTDYSTHSESNSTFQPYTQNTQTLEGFFLKRRPPRDKLDILGAVYLTPCSDCQGFTLERPKDQPESGIQKNTNCVWGLIKHTSWIKAPAMMSVMLPTTRRLGIPSTLTKQQFLRLRPIIPGERFWKAYSFKITKAFWWI